MSWPVLGNNGLKALRPKHQGVQTGKNDEDTGGPSSTSSGSTSTPKQRIQKGIQTSPSDADLNLQISDEESEEDRGTKKDRKDSKYKRGKEDRGDKKGQKNRGDDAKL